MSETLVNPNDTGPPAHGLTAFDSVLGPSCIRRYYSNTCSTSEKRTESTYFYRRTRGVECSAQGEAKEAKFRNVPIEKRNTRTLKPIKRGGTSHVRVLYLPSGAR